MLYGTGISEFSRQGERPPHQGARDGRRVDGYHQVPPIRIQPAGCTLSRNDGRVRPTSCAWAEPHQAVSGRCRKEGDCPGGMSEARGLRSPIRAIVWKLAALASWGGPTSRKATRISRHTLAKANAPSTSGSARSVRIDRTKGRTHASAGWKRWCAL
jgi:hypothetical protein